SMVDPNTGYGPTFNFGNTTASAPYYLDCGTGDVSTDCSSYGVVNNLNVSDTTYWLPNPGSWYKAVVIYHKGTVQTYINGTLMSTRVGQGTAALLCPNSQVIVGAWWNGNGGTGGQGLSGKLDNIRLYNRVLTPHEIATLSTNFQVTSNSVKPTPKTAH
ncbi:MAG TPA: LamG-like jellyroll fold domain-containing protein, partial [Puia sp.]|nr:LamG-like jellyroll fold domain-containing protein [Puia sp.]